MPGIFYPHTLKSYWYTEEVFSSLHGKLERSSAYLAPYEDGPRKRAYLEQYKLCHAAILLFGTDLERIFSDLNQRMTNLETFKENTLKSRVDDYFYDIHAAKQKAISDCLDLVKSTTRYLP